MDYHARNDLANAEMRQRFNPPDRLSSPLSLAFLAGLFLLLPALYPTFDLWRSRIPYIRLALGGVAILSGLWVLILIVFTFIDRLAHRPAFPSEDVTYRASYYVYKYFCLGSLAFGVSFSGLLAIHWFFQKPFLTLVYGALLCFQGVYILLRFKQELHKLYNSYQKINQRGTASLSFLGMLAFSVMMVINNITDASGQSTTALFVCIMHIWAAWYFLRLAILNFGRTGIHAGIGQNVILRSE